MAAPCDLGNLSRTTSLVLMEAEKDQERDWSSLPPEIINLFAKRLHKIIDFVRFRSVCTAWRLSAPITDIPPEFPWIFKACYYMDRRKSDLVLYSVTSDELYTIRAPKAAGRSLSTSFQGYLVTKFFDKHQYNTYHLSLLNPLNNHEIPLPASYSRPYSYRFGVNQIGEYGVCSVLKTAPNSELKLAFCALHQNRWCELKLVHEFRKYDHFFLKGMIFSASKETGITEVTNIDTGELAYVVPPVEGHLTVYKFIFLEVSGDILGVFRHYNYPDKFWYNVHQLDINSNGSPCWVKVKNIGSHAIFIDPYCGFVLKANNLAGIKENCIYLLKAKYPVTHTTAGIYEVARINIETGATKCIQCPLTNLPRWFVPNLFHL